MTDPAAKTHPEMALRCADCGHTWRAGNALWCPRCGCRELASYDPDWKPPVPKEPA
jgi:hypothetical protein